MGAPFSLLSFLKRNERIWSRVLQHPVQTMGSGEEGDELSHTKDAITSTPSPTHIITITYPPSPILHHSTPSPTHTYHHLPTLTYSHTPTHHHLTTLTYPPTLTHHHLPTHTYPPSPTHHHLPTLTYPPTLIHPHLPTITYSPSPTHPHLPTLTYPPSPTHPHLPTLTYPKQTTLQRLMRECRQTPKSAERGVVRKVWARGEYLWF